MKWAYLLEWTVIAARCNGKADFVDEPFHESDGMMNLGFGDILFEKPSQRRGISGGIHHTQATRGFENPGVNRKGVPSETLHLNIGHVMIVGQGFVVLEVVASFLEGFFGEPVDLEFVVFVENLMQEPADLSGPCFGVGSGAYLPQNFPQPADS